MIRAAIAILLLSVSTAQADRCARPDALGTARVMQVDPAQHPRVGRESFPQTLPLQDAEVVLTFDDGPAPPNTTKILDALKSECVRATFFVVGRNATAHPALLKRMIAEGHTIAYHTQSHANLGKVDYATAVSEIDRGIQAVQAALASSGANIASTPFFRFPYFESTPALLNLLQQRKVAVFGADFWASDWNPMTPQQQLALVNTRLEAKRRGIILFHDTKAQTAAMLPDFLRYLKQHNFRIVHVIPATAESARAR